MKKKQTDNFIKDYLWPILISLVAISFVLLGLDLWLIVFLVLLLPLLIAKRAWICYLIIILLFFEGYEYSLVFAGARVRPAQLIQVTAIISMLLSILLNRMKLKKTPIDFFLLAYILANFISLVNAPLFSRGAKTLILLVSLALLYYIVVNFLADKNLFDKAFKLLICMGFLQIIFGIYQVVAGTLNYYLGANLPIGFKGLAHVDFISSPWGRPYGTFVEPDWYGVICMFFALLFISLYISSAGKAYIGKKSLFFAIVVSVMGLILSFVRAAWLGFFCGILYVLFLEKGLSLKASKRKLVIIGKGIFCASFLFLTVYLVSPPVRSIIERRFAVSGEAGMSFQNVRFAQMRHSLDLFLKHPIIGNGPGSFAVYGIWGHADSHYDELVKKRTLSIERRYNPSIITTVLEDTGVIGTIFFILFFTALTRYNWRYCRVNTYNHYQKLGNAFFAGIIGLFVSYIFTHGFWIPFTWVFLGFNICAIKLGMKEKNN